MTLSLFNRPHQRIPQLSGRDALQGEFRFRCHECREPLFDIGSPRGVMWRCVNRDCAQRAPESTGNPGIEVSYFDVTYFNVTRPDV